MLIVMSPEPLKTGFAIVPLMFTSSARSPSSWVMPGTNCRRKFTELRGITTLAVSGVSSLNFFSAIIFGMSNGILPVIWTGWIFACCNRPLKASWLFLQLGDEIE